MNAPIPIEQNVHTSSEVPMTRNKPTISVAAAEKAAKEAGFGIIDAKQLKHAGLFGEFVAQVGAIQIGRSRLAMNIARADRAMEFCERAAESSTDPEVMMGLMKINADLIGKSNNAAELLIKSAQTAAETAKTEAMVLPGFAPRAAVGVTQVNVNVNGPVSEAEIKEVSDDQGS